MELETRVKEYVVALEVDVVRVLSTETASPMMPVWLGATAMINHLAQES